MATRQLSPAGYQKILQYQQSRQATNPVTGHTPGQTPSVATPRSGSSGVGTSSDISKARTALNLLQQGSRLTGQGGVSAGLSGLQAAAQAAQAAQMFQRGQYVPGSLSLGGAASTALSNPAFANYLSGLTGVSGTTLGGVGGALGGGLGLAGLGYSLSQGQGDGSTVGAGIQSAGQVVGGVGTATGSAALSAAGSTIGGIGAGVGATWAAGQSVHSLASALDSGDDRMLGAGIGSMAGLAAGAIIGTIIYPGIGTLVGMGVGAAAGGALGGLFGQNVPHYYSVRQHAMDVGKTEMGEYRGTLEQALNSGNVGRVQQALASGQGDNRIRVDFDLPKDVAAAVGVPEKMSNADLGQLPPEKFMRLLQVWRERKGFTENWLTGSGDIPYLSGENDPNTGRQGPAAALAGQASRLGAKTLDIVSQGLASQLDAIGPVAPLTWENVGNYRLSPELEYSEYLHQEVPTPYHQRGIDYERIRQLALQNQLGGFSVRGQRLAETVGGTPGISSPQMYASGQFINPAEQERLARERAEFESENSRKEASAEEERRRIETMNLFSSGFGMGA